ncbi:hypothetical protein [Streptomyces albogriseolus]
MSDRGRIRSRSVIRVTAQQQPGST